MLKGLSISVLMIICWSACLSDRQTTLDPPELSDSVTELLRMPDWQALLELEASISNHISLGLIEGAQAPTIEEATMMFQLPERAEFTLRRLGFTQADAISFLLMQHRELAENLAINYEDELADLTNQQMNQLRSALYETKRSLLLTTEELLNKLLKNRGVSPTPEKIGCFDQFNASINQCTMDRLACEHEGPTFSEPRFLGRTACEWKEWQCQGDAIVEFDQCVGLP